MPYLGNHDQPRRRMGQQRAAEKVDGAGTMRRKRRPVGKPHLFLSVEPSSLAGRALRAKPEGVGSGHGHRHQRHAQAFSAKGWGPVTGTAINATLKPSPRRGGVWSRALPQTPRSSLLCKRVGSGPRAPPSTSRSSLLCKGVRPTSTAITHPHKENDHTPRHPYSAGGAHRPHASSVTRSFRRARSAGSSRNLSWAAA